MKKIVDKKDTLLNYLIENIDMPKNRIKEYLKHRSIYVDGNNTTKFDYPVEKGSIIYIDTKKTEKDTLPFPIIYEDKNLIVVDKPAGLLTVATEKEKLHTLFHLVREYVKQKEKKTKIFVIHRLDKDTSGIVMFAKDEKTKRIFQDSWDELAKKREYKAIVHGIPKEKEKTLINNLKENSINMVYISKEGKQAITKYQTIKSNNLYSLLNIEIKTGRKNQIRVQLAAINNPILGDTKYGNDKEKRLLLHANKLVIYNPILRKEQVFNSELPKIFKDKVK